MTGIATALQLAKKDLRILPYKPTSLIMNTILQETYDKMREERLALQQKIREMKDAEAAILGIIEGMGAEAKKTRSTSSKLTVSAKIEAVLSEHPDGLDVNALTDFISEKFDEDTQKPSIQSQLSRMKDKTVVNDGEGVWRLKGVERQPSPPVRDRHRTSPADRFGQEYPPAKAYGPQDIPF